MIHQNGGFSLSEAYKMSVNPPPAHVKSDPNVRVYRAADFEVIDPEKVKPIPTYSGDVFSAVTFTMLPGQLHTPHSHTDVTQAWFILSGQGEAILGDDRREVVGPGTMIVHHPTQLHGILATGDENLVYMNISERPRT